MRALSAIFVLLLSISFLSAEIVREKAFRGYKYYDGENQLKDAEINGPVTEYFDKERKNIAGKFNFVDGKLHGWQEEYYNDGKIKFKYQMTKGMKDGEGKEYDENGILVYERKLIDGNGFGTEYYPDEKKIKRRIREYVKGEMKKISLPNHDLNGKRLTRNEESLFLEARGYIQDKWFHHAVNSFEEFYNNYTDSKKAPEAFFLIGYTYNNHIKDYDKAKEYYTKFLKLYPKHDLASSAQFELQTIGKPIEEVTNFGQ